MKPSVARIVHYVMPGGAHRPAVITAVPPIDRSGKRDPVNLHVFADANDDAPGCLLLRAVAYDETGMIGDTWHWAERVE